MQSYCAAINTRNKRLSIHSAFGENNPIYLEQKSFSQALSNFGGDVDAFLKSPQFSEYLNGLQELREADLVNANDTLNKFVKIYTEIPESNINNWGPEYINEVERLEKQIKVIKGQIKLIESAKTQLYNF